MKRQLEWYEVLPEVVGLVNRILLWGPPDTGKTTTAAKLKSPAFRVQCSRQMGLEDLLGNWILVKGETKFIEGPVPQAMRTAGVLVLDEFDMRNQAHDSIYHALLDDVELSEVRLPNGEAVKPLNGFTVVCTTNAHPGAFSDALQRRFELKLYCNKPHPQALDRLNNEALGRLCQNWLKVHDKPEWTQKPTLTALLTFERLLSKYKSDIAAEIVFGTKANEFLSAYASNQ